MLYPQMNKSRTIIDLNGLWKFRILKDGAEYVPGMVLEDDFDWIVVPASYNDQKEDRAYRNYAGFVVYQRTVSIPSFCKRERLVLRFDAVTNSATVYIDSEKVVEHKGGYLPFELELSEDIVEQDELLLTVLVDNRVSHSTLPVGNERGGVVFLGSDNAGIPSVEAGKQYQQDINIPNFDFFNYAGINRPVRIYSTPSTYIDDVTICPSIAEDGTTGIVRYDVAVEGNIDIDNITISIKDKKGNVVATACGATGTIELENANLWWPAPGEPYLYTACISYGEDYYEQTFGVRTVEVRGKQFLINGKPFYFKGFGKHEDFAVHGRGFNLCLDVKDVGLIHWLNANSFRTSHYPYAEEMYDLCDREGIVIIDEVPAVGIVNWPHDPYKTLPITDHHRDVIKDMITRDKNHPCVVMWSLGNEPDNLSHPQSALEYWRGLYDYAHSIDVQNRPVTLVCCQNDYTKDIVTRTMDVVCLNRYYGWYNLSGDIDAAMYALNIELDFWEDIGKPVMFSEYGADAVAGMHATVPEMFTEEYQAQFLISYGEEFDKRDFIVGEQMWNFADFGTAQGTMRADGNKKGLFTRERKPKLAAHALRHRWGQMGK